MGLVGFIFKTIFAFVMFGWGCVNTLVFNDEIMGTIWMVGAILLAWMPLQKEG